MSLVKFKYQLTNSVKQRSDGMSDLRGEKKLKVTMRCKGSNAAYLTHYQTTKLLLNTINSVPEDKILDLSKLKQIADDN